MHEAILLAALRRDETKSLGVVEPLHGALRTHVPTPCNVVLCSGCGNAVRTDTTLFVNDALTMGSTTAADGQDY
jgi:hypothetical protein